MDSGNSEFFGKYFTRDLRMDVVSNTRNIDEYMTHIESLFKWNNGVSDDIKNHFEVVKSLLVYSFYNYVLIDEAVKKTLFAYELAMKIRYEELTGKAWKDNWDGLIKKLYDMSLFDDRLESIQQDRVKRNFLAHPEGFKFGGVAFWNVMRRVVDNINGMYDDVEKRKERIVLIDDFNSFVEGTLKEGFEVDLGDKKLLGHEIYCLWINNKTEGYRYNLLIYYCTTDDFLKLDCAKDLPHNLLLIKDITFTEKGIAGLLLNASGFQKTIYINRIEKEETIRKIQDWKTRFESSDINFGYEAYKSIYIDSYYRMCKVDYLYGDRNVIHPPLQ